MTSVESQIEALRQEYQQWQVLLEKLSEEDAVHPRIDLEWSIKDNLVHLTSWQQVTLARLNAAHQGGLPEYPFWFPGADLETEAELANVNQLIHGSRKDQPWMSVYHEWQNRFQSVLEISGLIPVDDFMTIGKYPWLSDYPLLEVIKGSCEHHREHRESLIHKISKISNI
jgi:hypothetical protein